MKCKDLERINTVIQGEGETVDETFIELFKNDINNVILDYFNIDKNSVVNINKKNGELIVNISFVAEGIKLFKKL